MVAWSVHDFCGAVARRRNIDVDYGDECTLDEAGLTLDAFASFVTHASRPLEDEMVRAGWEVLDDLATAFLDRDLWWSR